MMHNLMLSATNSQLKIIQQTVYCLVKIISAEINIMPVINNEGNRVFQYLKKATFLSKLSARGNASEQSSRVRYKDIPASVEKPFRKNQKSVIFKIFRAGRFMMSSMCSDYGFYILIFRIFKNWQTVMNDNIMDGKIGYSV